MPGTERIYGRQATGPMLRPATTGFPVSGPPLPTSGRSGLRVTGAMTEGAMAGTVVSGAATLVITAG